MYFLKNIISRKLKKKQIKIIYKRKNMTNKEDEYVNFDEFDDTTQQKKVIKSG